ncbi:MAG: MoaD/ThiS family protein [Candidatus Thorarchaeota archaeon]
MRINVKLYATLRQFAPTDLEIGEAFPLELHEGTVGEAIDRLGIPEEKVTIIMVNGVRTQDHSHQLQDGDLLVLFPPVGGGAIE